MTSETSEFSEIGVESLMEVESSEFSEMGGSRFVPSEDLEDVCGTNGNQFAALNRYLDHRADFLNLEENSVQIVADAEDSNLKEIDQTVVTAGSNSFHAGKVKLGMCNSEHHAELPDSDENLDNAATMEVSNTCDGGEVKEASGVSCEENLDPTASSCSDILDMAEIVVEPNACNVGKLKMLSGDSENDEDRDRSFIFIGVFKIKLGTGELLINNGKTVSTNAYYCDEKRVAEALQSTDEEETNSNRLMEEDKETEIENEMITEMESDIMVAEEHESKTSMENDQHCDFASTDAEQAELEFDTEIDTEINIPSKGEPSLQVKNSIGVEGDNEHQPMIVAQTLLNEVELSAEAEDNFNVHAISTRVESGRMIVEEHESNTVMENDQHCDFADTNVKARHEPELESDVEIDVPSEGELYVQVKNSVGVEVDNEHQPMIVAQTLLNEADLSAEAEDNFSVDAISTRVESGTMIAEEHESTTVTEHDQYCDFAGRGAEARHQAELEFDTEIGIPIEGEPSVQVKNSVKVEGDNEHQPMMISQTVLNGAELSANVEDNFSVHAISTQMESGTLAAEEHESNTVVENDQHCDFAGTDVEARQQAELESNAEISIPSKGEPSVQVKNSVGVKRDNEHYPMTIAQTVLNEAELSAEVEDNFSVHTISAHKEDEDSEVVESEDLRGIPTPPFEPADSPVDAKILEAHSVTRQPCYIIRVPKFFDEQLKTNMEDARSQLDEKAQRRDSIRAEIKKKKAIHGECREKFIAVKDEEKAAKDAVSAKRKELDSVQSMINHVIKASSIDEINNKISELEHKIQHNTMSLSQEKEYLREIKQMKQNGRQLRDQLSEAEIKDIVDNREQLEEQFKTLKTELESLRAVVLSTERNSKAAWSKCNDEFQVLKDLQEKLRIVDSNYQEVYEYIQHLRREMTKRNSYFNIYKEDQMMAINYATVGDSEALLNHCENQVENVMHLFNTDEEFRQEYIKSNMKSTVRRLGSLDGRSLGPDEKQTVLPSSYGISSSVVLPSPNCNSSTPIPTLDLEIKEKISGSIADGDHSDQTNQTDKSISNDKKVELAVKVVNQMEEEIILLKEEEGDRKEEELTSKVEEIERKNEELRKAQAASELKEQLRLEQKAKAKEAEERKRRQVEKAKAKAEYHARKEADLREKKKAKKEKAGGSKYATNKKVEGDNVHVDTAPSLSDLANEPEAPANEPEASNKKTRQRSSKPQAHVKQHNKTEPLPLPLRDRGNRKMTTWMWFFLIILLVVILFLAGNYISVPNLSMPF